MKHVPLIACALILTGQAFNAHGQGLEFDGADDHVTTSGTALNAIGTGAFTMELWLQGWEADVATHAYLLSNRGNGAGMMLFIHNYWGQSQSKILALQLAGENYMLVDNGALNGPILDGDCHHVAVVREADTLRFYVDGAMIGTRDIYVLPASVANPGMPLWIGRDPLNEGSMNGTIGHVRIWNVPRTGVQIAAAYQQMLPAGTPGLVANWPMLEGSGQIVGDLVGDDIGVLGNALGAEPSDPAWTASGCAVQGVGISEPDAVPGVQLFPNPVKDVVQVQWGGSNAPVHVVDAQGRIVVESMLRVGRASLDLRNVAPGLYVVRVLSPEGVITARLVKQ